MQEVIRKQGLNIAEASKEPMYLIIPATFRRSNRFEDQGLLRGILDLCPNMEHRLAVYSPSNDPDVHNFTHQSVRYMRERIEANIREYSILKFGNILALARQHQKETIDTILERVKENPFEEVELFGKKIDLFYGAYGSSNHITYNCWMFVEEEFNFILFTDTETNRQEINDFFFHSKERS